MTWPANTDYAEAIQNPQQNLADAELKQGKPATDAMGMPIVRSGNFADVYEVRCPSGNSYAVKCFTREIADQQRRYQAISDHLIQAKLPFTVDFEYQPKGVLVKGGWFPILKMNWVEGLTLNRFVDEHVDKPQLLELLAQMWVKLAQRLRLARLAHADLQPSNVILVSGKTAGALSLRLIDYDGMFVPALANHKSGEVGHPNFQHPQRIAFGHYNAEVDRFSHLIIYTALRSLAVGGEKLWQKYDNGETLLFREADLKEPASSAVFHELWQSSDPVVRALTGRLLLASRASFGEVPLLDELLAMGQAAALSPKQAEVVTKLLRTGTSKMNLPPRAAPQPQTESHGVQPPAAAPPASGLPSWMAGQSASERSTPSQPAPPTSAATPPSRPSWMPSQPTLPPPSPPTGQPSSTWPAPDFRVSVAHPRRLAKGHSSTFLVQFYPPQRSRQVNDRIQSVLGEDAAATTANSSLQQGVRVEISLSSPAVTFSDPVIKTLSPQGVEASFWGRPAEHCRPGRHAGLLTLRDPVSHELQETVPFQIQIDDYAFDHISRPFIGMTAVGSVGVLALVAVAFTLLGVFDPVVGLTTGSVASMVGLFTSAVLFRRYEKAAVAVAQVLPMHQGQSNERRSPMTSGGRCLQALGLLIPSLEEDLRSLESLLRLDDVPSSLNKIRYICEKILLLLCRRHSVSWGSAEPTLERMIGPLVSAGCIPKDVGIHVRTIQLNGSPGSHYQQAPLSTSHANIAHCALVELLDWFGKAAEPLSRSPNTSGESA